MKNACRINDDGSISIFLNSKEGSLEAIVTKEHYDQYAEPFAGTWIAYKHHRTGHYYARGTHRDSGTGKVSQPMLHRLIMAPGKGEITAHVNHNTLDCRPENMRNIPIGADLEEILATERALAEILEDKPEKDIENKPYICSCGQVMYTPGVNGKCDACIAKEKLEAAAALQPLKGVAFHKGKGKWEVSPFFEKVRYRLGYWPVDKLDDANAAVTEFREVGPDEYFKRHPKKGKVGNV